jgi:hypothetical protein
MSDDEATTRISPPGAAPPAQAAAAGIPARPCMPDEVVLWLEAQLRRSQCLLEYGSGGSTRLAAKIGVPRIISVESDKDFAAEVQRVISASGSASVVDVLFADIGPTKGWGFPASLRSFRRWPNYALGAWDYLRKHNLSPDVILIDGRFRLGCFLVSLLDARPGTLIAFDDYADRRGLYGAAEHFLQPSQVIDRCAIFEVPERLPRAAISRALARVVSFPA